MNRSAIAVASLFLIAIAAGTTAAHAANCDSVRFGQRIVLKSAELDPDVFVWDSRPRVIQYASGYWKNTTDVMNHTVLSKPGTRAVIVQCARDAVHSRFANQILDAVGIKIVSGPDRGHYGWVTSEDVHTVIHTAAIHAR